MSYILDALKKSERERTLVRGVGFGDAARQWAPDLRWLWWVAAAMALIAVAVVVAVFVLRENNTDATKTQGVQRQTGLAHKPVNASVVETSQMVAETPAAPGLAQQAVVADSAVLNDVVVPAPSKPLLPAIGEARLFSAMPTEFQQSVPAMAVNIHVFTPDEAQRILYINNRQFRRGDEIPGGVLVEEIVPDGVVLQYDGQRFKLPRPS